MNLPSANNRFNAFQNYGQFLQKNSDRDQSKNLALVFYQEDQFANDMCSPSDIDKILKSKFYKSAYPSDLLVVNPYCPICGKFVKSEELNSIYLSERYNRKFLAHDKCLSQQSSTYLNDYFDQVQEMEVKNSEQTQLSSPISPISFDERQFCLQLSLTHPLSDYKFMKFVTKSNLKGNFINWKFGREEQEFCYLPNMICFPFIDFKITLTISQIGSQQNKKNFVNYINLSRIKLNNVNNMTVKSQKINVYFKIYSSEEEKEKAITKMNYKYQYLQQKTLPIIELVSLLVEVPEQQEYDQQIENTNNTIFELLSQKIEESSYNSPIYMYSNPSKYGNFDESISTNGNANQMNYYNNQSVSKGINDKSIITQKQKIDFQKLISTGKLSSYVRNSTQSRLFQNFLDEAHVEQIQIIINTLYDQFPELVIDEYANYMTQKLFQVCSPHQRIMILNKLRPCLPNLVRNKQGTHTIQFFTQKLTLKEEQELIMDSIRQQFVQLCQHSISTHFIQKIIKIFPLEITLKFFYIADKHFLKFATDKNAMCVLKYMMKGIKSNENIEKTLEIKKHFINSITLNTDKIIQDCYGNYVIQFCYQWFGKYSQGITEMIIEKFVQFSLQKYSSSVISKCISLYWADKNYANKLKQTLKAQGILQMYRNREGNKILLQLMDKNQNTPLRQKIYSVLANNGEPSRFYHQRWGLQIGIRSGPVGIQFKSFTDADTQHRTHNNTGSKKSKKK